MKQYLVIIFFSLISFIGFSQIDNDDFLVSQWTSGEYNQYGDIVKAGVRRGGPTTLKLNADSTFFYSTGFNCGYGSKMSGTWSFLSDTIILNLYTIEPYRTNPDFDSKARKLKFTITYLTRNELILIDKSGAEKLFSKVQNTKMNR